MDITVPDELLPLLRLLTETHLAECQLQAQLCKRTFGPAHTTAQRASRELSKALALRLVVDEQVAA